MAYISPINVDFVTEMVEQLREKEEVAILHKVNAVIDVDKDELLRALLYDRNQYEKGYEDGKKDRPKGKWIDKQQSAISHFHKCSNCGEDAFCDDVQGEELSDFCPYCGADMRGEE